MSSTTSQSLSWLFFDCLLCNAVCTENVALCVTEMHFIARCIDVHLTSLAQLEIYFKKCANNKYVINMNLFDSIRCQISNTFFEISVFTNTALPRPART